MDLTLKIFPRIFHRSRIILTGEVESKILKNSVKLFVSSSSGSSVKMYGKNFENGNWFVQFC